MKKFFNKKTIKKIAYVASAVLIATGAFLTTEQKPVETAAALSEEVPFWSTKGDNLFTVDGYGDLVVSVIRKNDGTSNGPLGFCLAKLKFFPGSDNVLYSNVLDKNQFTWDLGDGRNVTLEQSSKIDRAIYAFNFVYDSKLTNYGLDENDTMSLYHAAQIAIWSIAEGWTPDMVVKAEDTLNDETLNALADKIHALYTDIYNYAVNTSNKSFKSGTVLVDVTNDSIVANNTAFDVKDAPKYRANDGTVYYRSSLFSLISDQEAGIVWDGDYAYRYKVELEGAPKGARVVNANGNPQTEFSTKPGVGSDFYIEVPTSLANAGSFTVKVSTITFQRMDTVLWNPVSATGYQSLMQVGAIPDSGTATFNIEYPALEYGKYAQIEVLKDGDQLKSYKVTNTEYGEAYQLSFRTLPLEGAEFLLFMGEDKDVYTNMTDGNVYAKRGQMFKDASKTGSDGYVHFTDLPLDLDDVNTSYIIREVKAPNGYTLNAGGTAANEKKVEISKNEYLQFQTAIVRFTNEPFKFSFSVKKMLSEGGITQPAGANIIFGIYTNEPVKTLESGDVPKDAMVAIIRTDENGILNSDSVHLPTGYTYYLKELETLPEYELDTNKYYFDTRIPEGQTETTFTVDITNEQGDVITEIINYPVKYSIEITKYVQGLQIEDGTASVEYITIEDGTGYEFGIYTDYECTNLVANVTSENYENGKFISPKLEKGIIYYVKELAAPSYYEIDDEVKAIYVNDTTPMSFFNKVKTGTLTVKKYDITRHKNDLANAPLQSGVKFILEYEGAKLDEYTTVNGTIEFKDLPLNACYTLKEVVPSGYVSETETQAVCFNEGETDKLIRVNNYLSTIRGSVKLTKTDLETGEPIEGAQFSIYEASDVQYANPLGVDVTDENGVIVFNNLANKDYIIKETLTPAGYLLTNATHHANLKDIKEGDQVDVSVTNTPYYGTVRLTKTDADDENILIEGATYGLYNSADDELIETKTTDVNGQIIFTKLPYGSKVYAKEITAPTGYNLSTAKLETEINKVTKADYYELKASDEKIKINLAITKEDAEDYNTVLTGAEFKLYKDTDLTYSNPIATVTTNSHGLAEINNIEYGKYLLLETRAPKGYVGNSQPISLDFTVYNKNTDLDMTIYNAKEVIPTTQLTVKKTWSGDENYDVRPESISVQLLDGDKNIGEAVTLNDANSWTYTWTELDINGDWKVAEVEVPEGYTSVVSTKVDNTITITNVYTPAPKTELTVKKVWSGDDGYDVRPESILVQLLDGETLIGEPVELNEENNWTYKWTELDVDGEWTVSEVEVPEGYTSIVSEKANDTITITNTYTPAPTTELTVTKVWEGDEAHLADRPESVEVQLIKNSQPYGAVITLNDSNNWTYTWTELEMDTVWAVREVNVPEGYNATISNIVDNKVTITNKYAEPIIPTTSITVNKEWKGDENNLSARPTSVTVQLMNGPTKFGDPVKLDENNNWTYTWAGLSSAYTWSVIEVNVPSGYMAMSPAVEDGKVTITNTYISTNPTEPTPTPKPVIPEPVITERPISGVQGESLAMPLMGGACLIAGLALLVYSRKKSNK